MSFLHMEAGGLNGATGVYVCMYVFVYVCMCVCVYLVSTHGNGGSEWSNRYLCMYVCMFLCMYVCVYMCVCV